MSLVKTRAYEGFPNTIGILRREPPATNRIWAGKKFGRIPFHFCSGNARLFRRYPSHCRVTGQVKSWQPDKVKFPVIAVCVHMIFQPTRFCLTALPKPRWGSAYVRANCVSFNKAIGSSSSVPSFGKSLCHASFSQQNHTIEALEVFITGVRLPADRQAPCLFAFSTGNILESGNPKESIAAFFFTQLH